MSLVAPRLSGVFPSQRWEKGGDLSTGTLFSRVLFRHGTQRQGNINVENIGVWKIESCEGYSVPTGDSLLTYTIALRSDVAANVHFFQISVTRGRSGPHGWSGPCLLHDGKSYLGQGQ